MFLLAFFSLPIVTREDFSTEKSRVNKPNLKQIQKEKKQAELQMENCGYICSLCNSTC